MKPTANTRWRELDILRGLAALLMIVNHLGNETLVPLLPILGQLILCLLLVIRPPNRFIEKTN